MYRARSSTLKRKRFGDLIYKSRAMSEVVRSIEKTLDNDITVLIQGETGTGKELVAQAIHHLGQRRERGFFSQNCGAVPETLLESELFGHRKGSFSGAVENKPGFFELADGGTVFLDEIGEASLAFQVRLLRLLETGTFRRVGDTVERTVNVRVVAATNRDLEKEVARGRFREDLFYRLCVFPIQLPALRERKEDIPLLAQYFAEEYGASLEKPGRSLDENTLLQLSEMEWKGNVRELRNAVHRLMIMPEASFSITDSEAPNSQSTNLKFPQQSGALKTLEEVQRDYINHVLVLMDGNQSRAARHLGLNRNTFRARMKKLGIQTTFCVA